MNGTSMIRIPIPIGWSFFWISHRLTWKKNGSFSSSRCWKFRSGRPRTTASRVVWAPCFFFLGCGCDADGVTGRKNAVRDETRYDWDRRVVQDEWRQWGMGFSVTYWAPKKPVTKWADPPNWTPLELPLRIPWVWGVTLYASPSFVATIGPLFQHQFWL